MRHHDNKHTFPPPSRAWRRGGVQEAARGMDSVRIRDAVSDSTPGLIRGTATTLRDGASHQHHHLPPTTQFATGSTLFTSRATGGRRLGRILESRGGGGEIQEWELMNRGSLRPSVHARHRHRCPPRACHDANSSAASLGLHCVVTPFLPRESAGKPLLLATADACPRGLGCMFRRLRGHMVRCARGRAGRRNARQTCPGFSALLPTGRGGKQTTAQSANHHHVVGRAGGTVSGRRSVLRH